MQFGAHLPLLDLDGHGWPPGALASYATAARDSGYRLLAVNDHLVFSEAWLDGIVALASVIDCSGDLELATTVALPVVRGPLALAKAAAAIDLLSGGRLTLGVGPGSSRRDYDSVGVSFQDRWPRFEESVRVLRTYLTGVSTVDARCYPAEVRPLPLPARPGGPPIWVASWGSPAGMRRVARLGDGWLASAYNTTPAGFAEARATLTAAVGERAFPCALATMWTYVTDDPASAQAHIARLARMLGRPVEQLAERSLIGPPQRCAALVRAYAEAGVDTMLLWPVADGAHQLERFMRDVAPLV